MACSVSLFLLFSRSYGVASPPLRPIPHAAGLGTRSRVVQAPRNEKTVLSQADGSFAEPPLGKHIAPQNGFCS